MKLSSYQNHHCTVWLDGVCKVVGVFNPNAFPDLGHFYGNYITLLNSLDAHAVFTLPYLFPTSVFVVQSVRKSYALSGITGVLKCSPGALRELLRQDHRVSLRFTASLLGKKWTSGPHSMRSACEGKNSKNN